jgi:hypothetical protein
LWQKQARPLINTLLRHYPLEARLPINELEWERGTSARVQPRRAPM